MATLPILRSGYCWKVGNGSSISVLGNKWIPNHPTNKVLHPLNELVDEMAISELIDPEVHVWRSDLIVSLFIEKMLMQSPRFLLAEGFFQIQSIGCTIKMGSSLSSLHTK